MKRSRGMAAIVVGLILVAGMSFAEDEPEGWTGELAVGVTAQSGTVDTFSGTIDAKTERTWDEVDHLQIRFTGVYGTNRQRNSSRTSTETIQNAQKLSSAWKRTIHDRFFWLTPVSILRDNIQDLEVRVALATGPGYRLWRGEDADKHHFDLSAGPGYRFEIYDGNLDTNPATAENGDQSHFVDIVVGAEYKNMFFDDKIEYTHTASGRVPANETKSYLLTSEIIIGVPLTEAWSFRTSFYVEYVANPASDEINNTTTRTSIGLGYKF